MRRSVLSEARWKTRPHLFWEIFKLRSTWRVVMLIKVVSTRTVIIHQTFHEISYQACRTFKTGK